MTFILDRPAIQVTWRLTIAQVPQATQLPLFPPKAIQPPLFPGVEGMALRFTEPFMLAKEPRIALYSALSTPTAVQFPLFPPQTRQLPLFQEMDRVFLAQSDKECVLITPEQ